jgi:hypothetical protein
MQGHGISKGLDCGEPPINQRTINQMNLDHFSPSSITTWPPVYRNDDLLIPQWVYPASRHLNKVDLDSCQMPGVAVISTNLTEDPSKIAR